MIVTSKQFLKINIYNSDDKSCNFLPVAEDCSQRTKFHLLFFMPVTPENVSEHQNNDFIIRCIFSFLSIGWVPTTWPANNCLQIMVCSCIVPSKRVWLQIIFCSCVIATTFSREKCQIASLSCQEVIKIWKQTWWSNDKTVIELCYRKISWFVSVAQINYLPQPSASANNWSARHWQIAIFCSTSSSNC